MYPCLGLLLVEWYVAPGGLLQVLSVVLHVVDLEQDKKGQSGKNIWNQNKGRVTQEYMKQKKVSFNFSWQDHFVLTVFNASLQVLILHYRHFIWHLQNKNKS
jgi:hypothetical protein